MKCPTPVAAFTIGLCLVFLSACQVPSAPVPTVAASEPMTSTITVPTGYSASVALTGLRGPTQMIVGPDGRLWIAQLNGGENAGSGQIVAADPTTGVQEILLDGLTKPTGLAVADSGLWIVAGTDILRAPLIDNRPSAPEVVLADLPTNGRSNGTLTTTPDGRLLFETSGRRQGDGAVDGSGRLWALDPANPTSPVAIATGLKGAYAHAYDSAGRLWTTEISDDPVDSGPPPDEVNLIETGADYGWPSCYGRGEPALRYGGTAERCAATVPPVALLPQHSTPTSIIESPWEPGVLLVALWLSGEVARIDPAEATDEAGAVVLPLISGLDKAQHLLALNDGTLLISDHGTGVIYRVSQP